MLAKCNGCAGYARNVVLPDHAKVSSDASKYCSDECGQKANHLNFHSIIKSIDNVKSPKYFHNLINTKYASLQDPYTYDELLNEMERLLSQKQRLKQEIQKFEERLLMIDQIVENVYQINLNKSAAEMVCGFDYSIIKGDLVIHEERIEIPKYNSDSVIEKDEQRSEQKVMDDVLEKDNIDHDLYNYTKVCEIVGKCWKHSGWQKLKTLEMEIQIEELVCNLKSKFRKTNI